MVRCSVGTYLPGLMFYRYSSNIVLITHLRQRHVTMSTAQPFQFLNLPWELRLMIYDSLLTITRHHTIQDRLNKEATVVSKRIDGALVILACRIIYVEATSLRRKMQMSRMEPLRMSVEVGSLNAVTIEAILLYASNHDAHAHEGRATALSEPNSILKSCQDLKDFLGCYTSGFTRHVEIAIDCGQESQLEFVENAGTAFRWMLCCNEEGGSLPKRLEMLLRPRITSYIIAKMIEDYKVFERDKPSWLRLWKYRQGKRLCEKEWREQWEEGEKF